MTHFTLCRPGERTYHRIANGRTDYLDSLPQLPERLYALTLAPRLSREEERELAEHVWRLARMIRQARDGLSDEQRGQMEECDGSD